MPTSSEPLAPGEAIRFDAVGKRYRRGYWGSWSGDLREDVLHLFDRLLRRQPASVARGGHVEALRGVSFTVRAGENVGLLGANGAGKTTILKLISRVSRPSEGEIWVRGRVAALIQLGAGFHRELTGRENVYMLGAILGLGRDEIAARYDDIVAFAELGDHMDTPLKKYSSGMELRLGFSVAVHVEPDVLLVDEVLAVGDEAFRRKCQARMRRYVEGDATLLFVSHDLDLVRATCERCILLEGGAIAADGPAADVIDLYRARSAAPASTNTGTT